MGPRTSATTPLVLSVLALAALLVAACTKDAPAGTVRNPPAAATSPAPEDGLHAEAAPPEVHEIREIQDEGPTTPAVIILSGVKGYTEPCGCTLDLLLGGIDRVTASVKAMRELANGSLVLDTGDLLYESTVLSEFEQPQEVRKTELILEAMQAMGVAATIPGTRDLANGLDDYLERLQAAGIPILAANLQRRDNGEPVGSPSAIFEVGSLQVGVVGIADPEHFGDQAALVALEPRELLQAQIQELQAGGADAIVILFQGTLVRSRQLFRDVAGIDFIAIGEAPRESDEVEPVGEAWSVEAHDQGRYVGRLKLHCSEGASRPWINARSSSQSEQARLARIIENLSEQLGPEPADGQEEAAFVQAQRERLRNLQAEHDALSEDSLDFESEGCRFAWRPIPMHPGFPTDPAIALSMQRYNRDLRAINLQGIAPPPEAPEGTASFVGDAACASCHLSQTRFYPTMRHAHAWQTLVDRDKDFDRSCVGCHMTGYEQPGGSSLGFSEGLENVQCEACHGPGSLHVANPVGGLAMGNLEATCVGCHNQEHSPRFNYETYLPRILGEGHGHP